MFENEEMNRAFFNECAKMRETSEYEGLRGTDRFLLPILRALQTQNAHMKVSDLAKVVGCSEMTIRRSLARLSESGHLKSDNAPREMKKALTARQQQVLSFIQDSTRDRGYPPTLREIGAHMGIASTNGVNDHMRALERKGYITRDLAISRGIRLCDFSIAKQANKTNANMTDRKYASDLDAAVLDLLQAVGRVCAIAEHQRHDRNADHSQSDR